MSPQHRFARRFVAGLFILAAIASGVAGRPASADAGRGRVLVFTSDGLHISDPDGTDDVRISAFGGPDAGFTADGTKIFFTDGTNVGVMDSDGSHGKALFKTNYTLCARPSPDGTRILYSGPSGLELRDADGSNPRSLGVSGSEPRWSGDGSKIVYESGRQNIGVMNADGTDAHVVASFTGQYEFVGEPSLSPDGRQVAFFGHPNEAPGAPFGSPDYKEPTRLIYSVNADGTNLHVIGPTDGSNMAPTFSPDGSKLHFSRNTGTEASGWYTMNSDGSEVTRVSEYHGWVKDWVASVPVVEPPTTTSTPSTTSTTTPAAAYNGEIAYVHDDPVTGGGVVSIHPDGTERRSLPVNGRPLYSFDGSELAWSNRSEISSIDLTTNETTLRIPGEGVGWSLSRSTDGSRFAWTESSPTDGSRIVISNTDGTERHTILDVDFLREQAPTFIPGTNRIAFARVGREAAQQSIWTAEADGTDARLAIENVGFIGFYGLDVSRDGQRVTFSNGQITVANLDGSGLHALGVAGDAPRFSPDGLWIVFARHESGASQGIWLMRTDGTEVRQLTTGVDYFPTWRSRTTPFPPNQAPVAKLKFTQKPGHRLFANGTTSTDADGTIEKSFINWGDGSKWEARSYGWHQYKKPGRYLIRLSVVDDDGASSTRGVYFVVN